MKNCPFYGHALFVPPALRTNLPFILIDQSGNQCALIVTSHSPCRMEIAGEEPNWQTCTVVAEIRCGMGG